MREQVVDVFQLVGFSRFDKGIAGGAYEEPQAKICV